MPTAQSERKRKQFSWAETCKNTEIRDSGFEESVVVLLVVIFTWMLHCAHLAEEMALLSFNTVKHIKAQMIHLDRTSLLDALLLAPHEIISEIRSDATGFC